MLKLGKNNVDNETYHADREFLSSSVLKTIYKSLSDYHDQYILGNKKEMKNQGALDEGSLTHTRILEPHLVSSEFAFFPDFTKAGATFRAFEAANPGKKIISEPQKHRVDKLVTAFKKHPIAPLLLQNGEAEQTLCAEIDGVKVKTRCDYIIPSERKIIDIKTTSYPGNRESFSMTLKQLSYELSAALYCQVAEKFYGHPFDFYFVVLSKKDFNCEVYKTSASTMASGQRMVDIALAKYKKALETNVWTEFESQLAPHVTEDIQEV